VSAPSKRAIITDDRGGVRDLRERTARTVAMSYEDEYDDYEATRPITTRTPITPR